MGALTAVGQWRAGVEAWTVPPEILERSPAADARLEPERFRWNPEEDAKQPVRPSRRRALEALPEGGSVLDVGVGGGASSLGLVPRAGHITGVDQSEGMLASFAASAEAAGVGFRPVLGSWPQAAAEVEPVDVAVCHHVVYGVADLEGFVAALTAKARRRVVLELSHTHPLAALRPLWKSFHGIDRPDRDVAAEAEAAIAEMGLGVEREDIVLPPRVIEVTPALVGFARKRLHVGEERDAEIEAFLQARGPVEQQVAALWWPGAALE